MNDPAQRAGPESIAASVNVLVDRYRDRCLWFLRPDYYPSCRAEQLRVLDYIERYGDLEAFQRVGAIRQWLSRESSEPSVG